MVRHITVKAFKIDCIEEIYIMQSAKIVYRRMNGRYAKTFDIEGPKTFKGEDREQRFSEYVKKLKSNPDNVVWIRIK